MSLRIMWTGCSSRRAKSRFAAIGFEADETQSLAHGHTELADALLVVDDQQTDAKVFFRERRFAERWTHRAFPMVFSTAEMRSCTRNGFSR